jgi:hypothetical protein
MGTNVDGGEDRGQGVAGEEEAQHKLGKEASREAAGRYLEAEAKAKAKAKAIWGAREVTVKERSRSGGRRWRTIPIRYDENEEFRGMRKKRKVGKGKGKQIKRKSSMEIFKFKCT